MFYRDLTGLYRDYIGAICGYIGSFVGIIPDEPPGRKLGLGFNDFILGLACQIFCNTHGLFLMAVASPRPSVITIPQTLFVVLHGHFKSIVLREWLNSFLTPILKVDGYLRGVQQIESLQTCKGKEICPRIANSVRELVQMQKVSSERAADS